jgi:N6-L-threonylcarbamoyladenine synthase
MNLLALETSCDETAAAVIADGEVRAGVVSSQAALHAEYGGVVPELAARGHLRNLTPVVTEVLRRAALPAHRLHAVAATLGPGLPTALLVGARAAEALAWARGLPFLGVQHHEAHLYSPWFTGTPPRARWDEFRPNVSLIASGGHTLLVHVPAVDRHAVLGATQDDAAGECFDKTAKLLGLPYPGGPLVDRLAAEGDPRAFSFPRPLLRDGTHDFSFSGLKTAVRQLLEKQPALLDDRRRVCDLCAGVQAAIVEVLVAKLLAAARRLRVPCVTASGGVTLNRGFRARLAAEAAAAGLAVRLAEPDLCTDNAAMIGLLAERRLAAGTPPTPPDEEPRPGWELAEAGAAVVADPAPQGPPSRRDG